MIVIARDVDLISENDIEVVQIIRSHKMTGENFKDIVRFECDDFDAAIIEYGCDICGKDSSVDNPIYTNKKYGGCDICTDCVNLAFDNGLKPKKGWFPSSVYSLQKLQILTSYWRGPFGILVPKIVKTVPHPDRVNYIDSSGAASEVCGFREIMTKEEYKRTYCKQGPGGKWYYIHK